MDKDKFLELEYNSLRKEIEQTKERIFRITIGGATIVPAAQFLAGTYNVEAVTLLLPFLVIILGLLFLSENNALMRCGRYIRLHVEPAVEGAVGWETWLEQISQFDTRLVDRYVVLSFYLLSMFYYVVSVYLAGACALDLWNVLGLAVLLSIYISVGIWLGIFAVQRARTATTTKLDT